DPVREFDLLPRRLALDLPGQFRMVPHVREQDARLLAVRRDTRDHRLFTRREFELERSECVVGDDPGRRDILSATSADDEVRFLDRRSRCIVALRELLEDPQFLVVEGEPVDRLHGTSPVGPRVSGGLVLKRPGDIDPTLPLPRLAETARVAAEIARLVLLTAVDDARFSPPSSLQRVRFARLLAALPGAQSRLPRHQTLSERVGHDVFSFPARPSARAVSKSSAIPPSREQKNRRLDQGPPRGSRRLGTGAAFSTFSTYFIIPQVCTSKLVQNETPSDDLLGVRVQSSSCSSSTGRGRALAGKAWSPLLCSTPSGSRQVRHNPSASRAVVRLTAGPARPA